MSRKLNFVLLILFFVSHWLNVASEVEVWINNVLDSVVSELDEWFMTFDLWFDG